MRVLVANVQLMFTCETEGCKHSEEKDRFETDPFDLSISGVPMCPGCNEYTSIEPECFIKN